MMVGFRATLFGLAAALALSAGAVAAQGSGRITVTVIESGSARPLVAAQALIVGTQIGGLGNENGQITLASVPAGSHQLRVIAIGHKATFFPVTVRAGETTTLTAELAVVAASLDALVITGTASGARAREVGSSISGISTEQLASRPTTSIESALQGKIAGLSVLSNSGQPGAGGSVRLRGNHSVSQGNQPLVYIDGVRVYSGYGPTTGGSMQAGSPLNDISPSDIDRVEVVKGPAATTLYGTEAANGVIQIFTKKGAAGATKWNVGLTGGINHMGHIGPKSDPTGLYFNQCNNMDSMVDAWGNHFVDVTCPASGSWLENGLVQRLDLGMQGGREGMNYSVSGTFNDVGGVLPTGSHKDGGFRANFGFQPTKKLTMTFNNAYNAQMTRWVPEGNRSYSFILNVARGLYGQFKQGGKVANGLILQSETYDRPQHFVSNASIAHSFNDKLDHSLKLGYDYNAMKASYLAPLGFQRYPQGYYEWRNWIHTTTSLDYVANLRNSLGRGMTSAFSVGGQLFDDRDSRLEMLVQNFSASGIVPTLVSGALREVQQNDELRVINGGFFIQELFGWQDRLFLTAGLRVDGNSAFGKSFGLQKYPKFSASYILSDTDFWPEKFGTMKLRFAVGDAGKAPGAFDATRSWTPISANGGAAAFTTGQLGNAELGPERTREYEAGFDAQFWDQRAKLDFSYFHQTTTDALIPITPIPTLGFSNQQLMNAGKLRTTGFEATLEAEVVSMANYSWTLSGNFSKIENVAVDLGGSDILIDSPSGSWVREGYPVPSFFGAKMTNPDALGVLPVLAQDQFIGGQYPTRTVGLSSSLTLYKDLTINVTMDHQAGAFNQNATGWLNARRGVWQPCYATQDLIIKNASLAGVSARDRGRCELNVNLTNYTYWTVPNDYIKLRNVSVTYNIPKRLLPQARSATLTLSGNNLLTWTDYDGLDPESSDRGFMLRRQEYYGMPPYQTYQVSLRMNF